MIDSNVIFHSCGGDGPVVVLLYIYREHSISDFLVT